jgi:hypothetical protein
MSNTNNSVSRVDLQPLVRRLKLALADSIRRPMGVMPDSAIGLITSEDLADAETRRQRGLDPQRERLRAKAETMRQRMSERGADMLPDNIQSQSLRDLSR